MNSTGSNSDDWLKAGLCGTRGGESIKVLVELVLADGVLSDQALISSRMSETVILSGSNVRGTVIVSDLRWEVDPGLWGAAGATGEGRVRGEGGSEGSSDAQRVSRGGRVMLCGNVGSSCGFGADAHGVAGRGLLIGVWADGQSVPELEPRGIGRSESGRARPFEKSRGDGREMTWLNSREYHNASSSSSSSSATSFCSASSPGRGENGPRVNSKECASEAERGDADLIMRGCLEMRGCRTAAFLEGGRGLGDSSSEAPGVNGISVLEQADKLVREGVGERDRGGDRRRMSR